MASVTDRNKRLILDHFEALINQMDLEAIDRNLASDFYDHDGPQGRPEADAERPMIAALHERVPDVKVVVLDAVAEGDKVAVRNVWYGTEAASGRRIECHGFVLWRIDAAGKIAERWATVTSFKTFEGDSPTW